LFTMSNIYGHGFDRDQIALLEALGFRIRPQVSIYAGSQICRFIDFEKGPALELIEVEDHRAYRDFVPEGMEPYCPGISLVLPEGSDTTLADFEQEFHHLGPYHLHVNYDSSQPSPGPGWNYLNFKRPVVADTFIWLTAFDQPKPARKVETAHPNGVTSLEGLIFDLEIEDLMGLSQLVKEDFAEGSILVGEVEVWAKDTLKDFPVLGTKTFPLTAVLLKATNLDYFARQTGHIRKSSFMSQPTIVIETNRLSWDLLIVAQ
jgi:hypothetical protein